MLLAFMWNHWQRPTLPQRPNNGAPIGQYSIMAQRRLAINI
ncbi:MAG: hypothetical protein ACRD2P_01090 [Terriglobia bacterium]